MYALASGDNDTPIFVIWDQNTLGVAHSLSVGSVTLRVCLLSQLHISTSTNCNAWLSISLHSTFNCIGCIALSPLSGDGCSSHEQSANIVLHTRKCKSIANYRASYCIVLSCVFGFWEACAYCSKPSWSFSPVDVSLRLRLSFTVITTSPFISSAVLCIFKMQTMQSDSTATIYLKAPP